jgi:hypothetical protein
MRSIRSLFNNLKYYGGSVLNHEQLWYNNGVSRLVAERISSFETTIRRFTSIRRGRKAEKTVRRFDKLKNVQDLDRLSSILANRDAYVQTLKMGWECGMYEDTIELHDELSEELERRYGFESGLDIFEILIRCCYHLPKEKAPYNVARRIVAEMYQKKNLMVNMRIVRALAFLAREDPHNCNYVRGLMRDVWARLEEPNANDYLFKIDVYSFTGQPDMSRRTLMEMMSAEDSSFVEPRHYTAVLKSFLGHPQGMEVAQALLDEMIQTGHLPPPYYGDDETLLSHDQVNAYGYAIRIALECGSAEQTLSYFTALNSSLTDNLLVKDTNRIFNALRDYSLKFVERVQDNERTTQTNKNLLEFARDLLVLLRHDRNKEKDVRIYVNCVFDFMKACHHSKEYGLALSAYESLVVKPNSELYGVDVKKLDELALHLCMFLFFLTLPFGSSHSLNHTNSQLSTGTLSADERNLNLQMPRIGFVWEMWARLNNDPVATSQKYGLRFLRFLLKASRRELVDPSLTFKEEEKKIYANLFSMWQSEIEWNDSAAQSAALARIVHILSVQNDSNGVIEISRNPAYESLVRSKVAMAAQDLCETHSSTLSLSYSIALLPVLVSRSYFQIGHYSEAMSALEPLEPVREEWDKYIHEYATRAFSVDDYNDDDDDNVDDVVVVHGGDGEENDFRSISVHDRETCGYALITSPRVSKVNHEVHERVVEMICRHYGLLETSFDENHWKVLSMLSREPRN